SDPPAGSIPRRHDALQAKVATFAARGRHPLTKGSMPWQSSVSPSTSIRSREFRAGVYDCFCARRDALFELLDAATVDGLVPSLAYLSLPPVHRRRWGSLYDALAAGDIDFATAGARIPRARYGSRDYAA